MPGCQLDFASIVIIDDFSLAMPETSRSGGDLCLTHICSESTSGKTDSPQKVLVTSSFPMEISLSTKLWEQHSGCAIYVVNRNHCLKWKSLA